MKIPFSKYQGTGNDFIIIDQRQKKYIAHDDQELIELFCHRKFGIGADGLILLENIESADFNMIYFNADGRQSSMCGNGGRCITAFANEKAVISHQAKFNAIDGLHEADIRSDGEVALQMQSVDSIQYVDDHFILDTGSPHYVAFVEDVDDIDVKELGSTIRYSAKFREEGINVNFVELTANGLNVATYERGVEDETLSCGTGVTAAALAFAKKFKKKGTVAIKTKGGDLKVGFDTDDFESFRNIWLIGPATKVFEGFWILADA